MDDHDQALAWAQANPKDPRAQDVMAKAWASKNPNDPRAAQILQKLGGQAPAPAATPESGKSPTSADTAIKMSQANGKPLSPWAQNVMRGTADAVETPQGAQRVAASALLPGAASAMSEGAGLLGRLGTAALQGGSAAVANESPDDSYGSKLAQFLKGGLTGTVMQGLGEGLSSTGRGLADVLMKKAVGIRKAPEGIGNTLVDQGVWGTRSGMLDQVGDKLPAEESKLQSLVAGLKGNVDSQEIADAISQRGNKLISPSGITISQVEPDLQKIKDAASDFSSMGEGGELTPQDLLSLKRQGDWAGYTASGNPASATDAEIGRTIADKSRSLLSDMSGGETANTLKNEQALIFAKKALERDPTTHMGVGSQMIFGKVPGQDILGSLGAQASQKTVGGAGDALKDPTLQQALYNGLFGSGSVK